MADWEDYKGIEVPEATPTGDAGLRLKDDLKELADRAPNKSASDPTTTDDSAAGYFPGSLWFNSTTQVMWVCTDATASAAVWKSLYKRESGALVLCPSTDGQVRLGDNLDVNGKSIVSQSNGDITLAPDGTGKVVLDGLNWPTADGSANQVLQTDGAGNLSFATGGGGTPGGADTQVQFNDGGAFGGNASFTFNKTTGALKVENLQLEGNTLSSTDTNGPIIVSPNGTGSVQLDTGGNTRGSDAVDLQSTRDSASQVASGARSFIAGGRRNTASGDDSHAEGQANTASGNYAHAEGYFSSAQGAASHAEGKSTSASGTYTHAEGFTTTAYGTTAHAEGKGTTASGSYSHAEGRYAYAGGSAAHAEGTSTSASGDHAHAEGYSASAGNTASHAEGASTSASANYAHAEGFSTMAQGTAAHAEGSYSNAYGNHSHAEGVSTYAGGEASHAEGSSTGASGSYSHAEGVSSTASGFASHAAGSGTHASSNYAHAEGHYSVASALASHAGGIRSKAHLRGQWARAAGGHSSQDGTAQATLTQLFRRTTDGTGLELTLDGNTPGASNRFNIVNGQTLACVVNIVGRKENGGANDHAMFLRQVLIRRESTTTQLVGSVQTVGTDINPASWGGVTITADDTNESLKISVTGAASTNIRWTAVVLASEAADAGI